MFLVSILFLILPEKFWGKISQNLFYIIPLYLFTKIKNLEDEKTSDHKDKIYNE